MHAVRWMAALMIVSPAWAAPVPVAKPADEPVPKAAALLLRQRKVQKELRLSGDQRIAIVDGIGDIEDENQKAFEKLSRMPNPTPDAFDKLEDAYREKSDKFFETAAARILAAEHRKRLKEIDRQVRGLEAFAVPESQRILNLTDPQKQAVAKAIKEQERKIESFLNQLGNDDADTIKDDILKHRNEQTKALVASFNEEQKTLWTSLLGQPVKSFNPVELWFNLIELDELPPAQ